MKNETRKDQNTMASAFAGPRMKKTVGAVAAAGVALGGLAVIAPDADATAYGETCDLVLNTDAPNRAGYDGGDPHWTRADAQTSMGGMFTIPVYKGHAPGGGSAVSSPFAPMSTASMAPAAAAGQVICVVGRHAAIINGTGADDTIYGGAGNETINGGAGDDVIFGGGGDDVLIGKAGHDSIDGGAGNDILFGHGGRNSAVSEGTAVQEGRDTLTGGAGDDLLRGDRGDDLLNGNAGDDCLLGGKGNDEAYGWDGDDTIGGGSGADYLAGNDNNDNIFGGKGNDTLRGNDGLDQVWGDSDLYDIGLEMTVAKGEMSISVFGPEPLITPNGAVNTTIANIFVSSGTLARGKQRYISGWSSARPEPKMTAVMTYTYTVPRAVPLATPMPPVVSTAVATMFTTMRNIALSARSEVYAMTLAHSSLATSQIFAATVFTAVLANSALVHAVPKDRQLGDPLATSGAIMGPLVVPPTKYDTVNSSNLGGIAVPMATVEVGKVFRADIKIPKRHLHKEAVAVAMSAPGAPITTMVTMVGLSVSYIVSSTQENLVTAAAPTITSGATYVGMVGPLEPPRMHKYASSIGITPAGPIIYSILSSSGGTAWNFTSTVIPVSTHVHVKFAGPATGPITPGIQPLIPISSSFITAPRPAITMPLNHVAEVYTRFPLDKPHFRNGHLEVAACNLDAVRMMDDVDVPKYAFSGISLRGLAGMHESMVAASSRGDLEVPLLNNELAGGPGPSGAFVDWPIGVAVAGYDDDIRGGDADDVLYGEAGSDTVWGDHGDDTIFGEGDNAAYVLGEAAFNVAPGNKVIGGVPTKAWSNTKRKLPVGLEEQYPGASGNDSLSGNIDDDSIEGGPGNDNLYGGPDDDHLLGNGGADTADGGGHWDACQPSGGFVSNCEIVL